MGHTITPNSKAISEKRIKAIKDVPRPITKRQLLSFLGMCAYCRTFIPNYAFLEKPLRALTTGKGLRSCDKIERPFTQMADKCVTIYTDSRYAFGVTHDFGALWKHRIFLRSDGHPILNASLVSKLLEAILLPDEVAICKCAAHTNDKGFISTGNGKADAAAKAAAAQETKETTCALVSVTNPDISPCLQSMQTFSTGAEKQQWRSSGCSLEGGVWMSVDDIPCLPKHFFQHYAKLTHGLDHVSKGIKELWFTKGLQCLLKIFAKDVSLVTHTMWLGE